MTNITKLAKHIKARDNPTPYTPMLGKIISLPELKIRLGTRVLLTKSDIKVKLPAKTDVIDIIALNSNLSAVDAKLSELKKKTDTVQLSDTLEIISASGSVSFYHGTSTPFMLRE